MPIGIAAYDARKLRQRLLDRYGRLCVRCGFADERALQLDHINGGGNKELKALRGGTGAVYRKAIRAPDGEYQILCANCNWIKRVENSEVAYGGAVKALVI